MKVLSKRIILRLHADLIEAYGGTDGVRDEGLLDSAIHASLQSFGGEELYPTLLEKAARLWYGLIKNHPFIDGNKRIGTHAMLVFLDINHETILYEDEDLINAALSVADGTMSYERLLQWLREHVS